MNSVNDLQHQGRDIGPKGDNHSVVKEPRKQNQTVSLSYLRGEDADRQNVNINTLEMKDIAHQNTQEIVINNIPKRKVPVRRTAGPIDSVNTRQVVDGSAVSNTLNVGKDEEQSPKDKMMSDSFSALDKAVKRKKDEYHQFVEHAIAADKINRARVEDGIEEAPKEEILYRLSDVDPERAEENKDTPKRTVNDEGSIASDGEYVDDMEKELEDELNHQYNDDDFYTDEELNENEIKNKIVIGQNHSNIDQEYDNFDNTPIDDTEDNYSYYEENMNQEDTDPAEMEYPQEDETSSDDDYKFDDISIVEKKEDTEEPVPIKTSDERVQDIMNDGIRIIKSEQEDRQPLDSTKVLNTESVDLDENDFDDIDIDDEEEKLDQDKSTEDKAVESLTDEERREIIKRSNEHLRSEILEKIVDTGKKRFNTSSVKISNKVVSIKDALSNNRSEKKEVQRGKFPLLRAGRPIVLSALTGLEIATISNEITNIIDRAQGYEGYQLYVTPRICEILYKHDTNPNKPSTAKAWAKTIPAFDINNLYAAVHIASLTGSNYFPRICENQTCRYSFLEELNDIKSFIKFNNENTEKKYKEIMNMPDYDGDSSSFETVVQIINEKYAVGIRDIPLHFFVYELPAINLEFVEKYMAIINIIALIDDLYLVSDDGNGGAQLNKIGYKKYPMDEGKNLKSKVLTYGKIFQEFSDSDFAILNAYTQIVENSIEARSNITWNIPETKCPKCGRTIYNAEENRNFSSRDLVFMKQRLAESLTTLSER